jgi:phosphoglycerate kinase
MVGETRTRRLDVRDLPDEAYADRRVFVRVDFNVPLGPGGITDDTRIRAALPTIGYLADRGARVILASHLGRPKGKVAEEFRMTPVVRRLQELRGGEVVSTDACIGPAVEAAVAGLRPGQVLLLENLRFWPEEEAGDDGFARALAGLADIYVNDAFGAAHRAHASTAVMAKYSSRAVAGLLTQAELTALGRLLERPERPFVAVLGGAKVKDKLGVIHNLLGLVDTLILGGGMANTFLAAQGRSVGASLLEKDLAQEARDILDEASRRGKTLLLPVDLVVADAFSAQAAWKIVGPPDVPPGWWALDIGPASAEAFAGHIRAAGSVFWNGPVGVYEFEPFMAGTKTLARAIAESRGFTVVGGGDSVAALTELGLSERVGHLSTGGGASLEFMEGLELPGVACLESGKEAPRAG